MSTCFLFLKYLTEDGCLSLRLNAQGIVDAPLLQRNFSEIQQLQAAAKTIAVVSSEHFSFHQLELAWLPEKKARTAIPFALEEKLAQNVEELHFAFNKNYYQDGKYLILVCNKNYITYLIEQLEKYTLAFDYLTLDWFALNNNEACYLEQQLLIRDNAYFNGILNLELAIIYLKHTAPNITIFTFNANSLQTIPHAQLIHEEPLIWIAKRLVSHPSFNICQGEFTYGQSSSKTKKWYYAAAFMSAVWLISLFTLSSIEIFSLNKQLQEADQHIATLYREFFPQAQQIISPRFRIGQLLKGQTTKDTQFWLLLDYLTKSIINNDSTVEQLRYQNQIMQVTTLNNNFKTLEALQTNLQSHPIHVKQTQASSQNGQVLGILELSL